MGNYWIIGGTSGIGSAVADQASRRYPGAIVSVTGEADDVTSVDFDKLLQEFCYPQNVVYSAGINHLNWLGKGTMDEHLRVLDVNLFGFLRLMDSMARVYTEPANVVAISSDAATRPMRTSISYCASKAGLDMAVRVAARELGPHGWRINAVSPGMTKGTKMTDYVDLTVPGLRGWTPLQTAKYEKSQEVAPGRLDPSEVAEAVLFCLNGPKHLNGEILTVNGGR